MSLVLVIIPHVHPPIYRRYMVLPFRGNDSHTCSKEAASLRLSLMMLQYSNDIVTGINPMSVRRTTATAVAHLSALVVRPFRIFVETG